MTVTWRRFELGGMLGSSFELAVDGAAVIVRISSGVRRGRDQRRELGSPEAAAAEAVRLVERHLARGYVEAPLLATADFTSSKAERDRRAAAAAAQRAAAERAAAEAALEQLRARVAYAADARLEAQCRADPDDPAPWSVYADFLLGRGDPRGTIATDPAQRDDVIALHGPRLCGTAEPVTFDYRHGFAVGATVKRGDLVGIARGLLASPMGTFLGTLRYGLPAPGGDTTWPAVAAAIAQSPRAADIHTLRFDAYDYDDYMMHWVDCGAFGDLFAQLPALVELRLRGNQPGLGALPPTLRVFVRESCTTRAEEVAELAARRWPALEHLELWFGNRDYGATAGVAELAPFLDARAAPRLRHLGIVNSELAEDLIPALAASRLLPQLESLDLSMGTFGEAAARALVVRAARFRHLASIDLADNLLAPEDVARLRAVLDNVIVAPQRDAPEDDDMRYVAEHE